MKLNYFHYLISVEEERFGWVGGGGVGTGGGNERWIYNADRPDQNQKVR